MKKILLTCRVTIRLLAFLSLSTAIYLLWFSGLLLIWRFPRRRWQWRRLIVRAWAGGTARIARIKINLRGHPPDYPFLLVSNHLTYADIIVYGTFLNAVFVAKSEISGWPVLGPLSRAAGTIFIRREHFQDIPRVMSLIKSSLEENYGLIIFAEGGTSKGESIAPLKPALLEPAVQMGFPIHYASITYRTPPGSPAASEAVCWWGDVDFVPHLLGLLALPGFEATVTFGARPLLGKDRKLLARDLWQAMSAEFIPVDAEGQQFSV